MTRCCTMRGPAARVFFVTSAFIGFCGVQIVRKGAKDLGHTRPLGTKLVDLPTELLVVSLQRGHPGLELLLLSGRLRQPVHEALGILEPPSDFCAEV
jgi:hypothetical protein